MWVKLYKFSGKIVCLGIIHGLESQSNMLEGKTLPTEFLLPRYSTHGDIYRWVNNLYLQLNNYSDLTKKKNQGLSKDKSLGK